MKKLLGAAALAVALLAVRPAETQAYWGSPQCAQGFGWLKGHALNFLSWNHFEGPIYSYGPYNTPGYVPMFVKNPHVGAYNPAYPAAYYGYGGYGGYGYGAPAGYFGAAPAPAPVPAVAPAPKVEPIPTAGPVSEGYSGGRLVGLRARFGR
jgi:hypothetical protein